MSQPSARGAQVNVVVVNWNGRRHLADGLPSLLATRYANFQVTVLDNGSTDDSLDWLVATYPAVQVTALGRNLGFAAANNVGMQRALDAGMDYVALLNNDTRVEPDWLAALVDAAEADPAAAICQARQRTWGGQHEIRFRFIPEWAEAEQEHLPVAAPGPITPTPFASGAAMLIRCAALGHIGLFDERYFMYVEDVDLTLRAWIAGYRVLDVPASIVYHRMTGSDSHARQRMFWGYRNQLTTLLKLYEPTTLRHFAGPIGRRWFWTRNRFALRGTLAALAMLPGTLARRRQVQRNRRAPDSRFLELCRPVKILHVTDHYTPRGGVEQYILNAARLLADHGHGNAILYTQASAHTIRDGAWPAYHIRTDGDIAAQVDQVLAAERPDVAYIHHVSSPALVEALAERLPAVAYVHGFTAVCPGLGKYFRRGDTVCTRPFGWGCVPMHYLRRCSDARRPSTLARLMRATAALQAALLHTSRFLVGSRYMAELLAQNGFPVGKIAVLPPHFLPDDLSLAYTPPTEPFSVLYAGRLEIEKGVPYLLQALARLPGHVRLEVAGDGTQRGRYEALARELGLAGRVAFLGWLDEEALSHALRRCALLAMPSIFPEPFGKSGIDALTYGRPVVAFDVGGISDWLHDGVDGYLVPAKDTPALAGRIGQLVDDHGLGERMGRAGQAGVVARYAASRHLAALAAAFHTAINDHE